MEHNGYLLSSSTKKYDGPKGYTILEAIDDINDAQMAALERAAGPKERRLTIDDEIDITRDAPLSPAEQIELTNLYDNLRRMRAAVKGRMK